MPENFKSAYSMLQFDPDLSIKGQDKLILSDLSAVELVGTDLWLASDESLTLERLSWAGIKDGMSLFGHHAQFQLSDFLKLPKPPELFDDKIEEADIEGLAYADGYLWLAGSHSLKRKEVRQGESDGTNVERLAKVRRQGNRYLLARIPISYSGDVSSLQKVVDDEFGYRTAASLKGDANGNELIDVLMEDAHIGPFLNIPGKDNGFDIEGLAVSGERVFLGLRGPVLRGYAIILEVRVEAFDDNSLKLKRFDDDHHFYRKHFINLSGMGVRDLCFDGSDLLILSGPTMDLSGRSSIDRWPDALSCQESRIIYPEDLSHVAEMTPKDLTDKAEGLCRLNMGGYSDDLLMVFDSPSPGRVHDHVTVMADIISNTRVSSTDWKPASTLK